MSLINQIQREMQMRNKTRSLFDPLWTPVDFPLLTFPEFEGDFPVSTTLQQQPFKQLKVDIVESPTEYQITGDLPGVQKKDIKVTVKNDVLTIAGEREWNKETKKEDMVRSERFYGKASRSLTLPDNVDASKITSKYENGLLQVHLPKLPAEQQKKKQIDVQVA